MNTHQLYGYLEKVCMRKKASFDVIPCDELNQFKVQKYPICLIVNSDPSHKPGEHWLCIYMENVKTPLEFYDSYGLGMESFSPEFTSFANRLGKRVVEIKTRLQALNSTTCGAYCVYILYMRLYRHPMKCVYKKFSNNYNYNDKLVSKFITQKQFAQVHKCKFIQKKNQCCTKF
jgi:hypothetical protein